MLYLVSISLFFISIRVPSVGEVCGADFPVGVIEGGRHYSAQCYGRLFGGVRRMGHNEVIRIGSVSGITSKQIKALFLLV